MPLLSFQSMVGKKKKKPWLYSLFFSRQIEIDYFRGVTEMLCFVLVETPLIIRQSFHFVSPDCHHCKYYFLKYIFFPNKYTWYFHKIKQLYLFHHACIQGNHLWNVMYPKRLYDNKINYEHERNFLQKQTKLFSPSLTL
jgi:hypothetical protein